jgi:hypothetical protein
MSSPHPLAVLFEAWPTISEGQRQAIARDFHSHTGAQMSTTPQALPTIVALVPVLVGPRQLGVIARRVFDQWTLPQGGVHPELSVAESAAAALPGVALPASLVSSFEPAGPACVSHGRLWVPCMASQCLDLGALAQDPHWGVVTSPQDLPLPGEASIFVTWSQLAPLRLAAVFSARSG